MHWLQRLSTVFVFQVSANKIINQFAKFNCSLFRLASQTSDKTPIKPDTLPNEMSLLKKKPSSIPISTSVTFECSFHNQWSLQRHPVRYPPDAHWSNPVLLTHPRSFKMWERGTLASPGTKILAEVSTTNVLLD